MFRTRYLARFPLAISVLIGLAATADGVTVTLDAGDGFVVKDKTGAIERLRVDEATGNVSRNGALFVHTTGLNTLSRGLRLSQRRFLSASSLQAR